MEKLKLYGKKDNGREEFLGVIYVNEKKEIVIDVKNPQVRKDISQEINQELQKQGGLLLWPKCKDLIELYGEKETQEFRRKIKLLSEKDKSFKKYLENLGNLWRENIRLSKEKEKLLDKKGLEKKEIEKVEEKIKEVEEKIKKEMPIDPLGLEEKHVKFWEIEMECFERGHLTHTLFEAFSVLRVGLEKPGNPLFLAALRSYLASSGKKYGGYILSKQSPIVEED